MDYKMKKLANIYSTQKTIFTKELGWHYITNNGYLFSNLKYKTKIKPQDLPEYYLNIYAYHNYCYINTKGIKYLLYTPNYNVNHFLKDDLLYISYDKSIEIDEEAPYLNVKNYEEVLYGPDILEFIEYALKYSNYSTSNIKKEIKKHYYYYYKKYQGEIKKDLYPEIEIDYDELDKLIESKKYVKKTYIK